MTFILKKYDDAKYLENCLFYKQFTRYKIFRPCNAEQDDILFLWYVEKLQRYR